MWKFQDTSLPMEERVQDLLAHLTLAEKIGLLSIHQLPIPRLDIGLCLTGSGGTLYGVSAAHRHGVYL